MTFFNLLTLCCGLAFFLFGMNTMSRSLERLAGGKLEGTLKKKSENPIRDTGIILRRYARTGKGIKRIIK